MNRNTTLEVKSGDNGADLHKAGEDSLQSLKGSAQALAEQATQSAADIGDVATQEATRVGALVRQWLDRQSEQARQAAAAVRDEAVAAKQRTARYVADEPMKSVLFAAAAGALLTGLAVFASSRRRAG
jgi:ElaB/YqjD/DUF883 family membrane-anchored ribosome-binding protein